MNFLESALNLARDGFRVFPLTPDSRSPPLFDGWKESATVDEATITAWWARYPSANIGVATGKGLLVIDADCKKGKRGLDSLAALEALGLPESFRVRTGTGGIHVYLRVPTDLDLTIGQGSLEDFPDVDFRCAGGYVVGPGSVVDGSAYVIL